MIRPTFNPESRRSASMGNEAERPPHLDEVRGALISAVCHAHRNDRHVGAPPFLTPMPLDRVVETLIRSDDQMARVLAGCWLLDNPSRAESLDRYATALLGRARVGLQFADNLPGSVSFSPPSQDVIPQTRFGYACDRLLGATSCSPKGHAIRAWVDADTQVTTVIASVDVNRHASQFREHADPRGWETNAPLFFKESRICDKGGGDFETRPNPAPVGDADYYGLLLEHVSFGFAPGLPIESINVLNADCRSQDHCPNFSVSLHACLERLLGMSASRGGLDVDRGAFTTTSLVGVTRLRGTKEARFTEREVLGQPVGRLLNYFAPFCLAALMSILIFGGACYDPK